MKKKIPSSLDDHLFWQSLEMIIAKHKIIIDRPKGSAHPRYPEFIYPADYGYVEGLPSSDGSDLDIWKGTIKGTKITGLLCTTDQKKNDIELK